MYDVHSHILPGMDDGSRNAEESIELLRKCAAQGIKYIAATPHFYPVREYPDDFIKRRNTAFAELQHALEECKGEELPRIIAGAEVAFYDGISRSEMIRSLCYEKTSFILVEMPCSRWSDSVINEIIRMPHIIGLRPVIAHIDRYLCYQKRHVLEEMVSEGVMIQANAEYFLDRGTSKKALKLLDKRLIHIIGSDCHDLTERAPNAGDAIQLIRDRFGDAAVDDINSLSRLLFEA